MSLWYLSIECFSVKGDDEEQDVFVKVTKLRDLIVKRLDFLNWVVVNVDVGDDEGSLLMRAIDDHTHWFHICVCVSLYKNRRRNCD